MEFESFKTTVRRLTYYLEFILALFIVAAVIIGMWDLVKYIMMIFKTNPVDTYDVFQKFLGHVLIMVVGVELVVMLVYHSPSSVIEVLLYAVARKLLIGNQGMLDFVLGIAAIAAIFAIRRFIYMDDLTGSMKGHRFAGTTAITAINELLKIELPVGQNITIGGLAATLAEAAGSELYKGMEMNIMNVSIRIIRLKNGIIEKVLIRINEG